jgi:hypothetical protein
MMDVEFDVGCRLLGALEEEKEVALTLQFGTISGSSKGRPSRAYPYNTCESLQGHFDSDEVFGFP